MPRSSPCICIDSHRPKICARDLVQPPLGFVARLHFDPCFLTLDPKPLNLKAKKQSSFRKKDKKLSAPRLEPGTSAYKPMHLTHWTTMAADRLAPGISLYSDSMIRYVLLLLLLLLFELYCQCEHDCMTNLGLSIASG